MNRLSTVSLVLLLVSGLCLGCDDGAEEEQATIRIQHFPALLKVLQEDMARHREGIDTAAERLAPGFVVEDLEIRERQMRTALKYVQEPPRGVPEFIVSPMSFLAAIGKDGVVFARDSKPEDDKMKGKDFGERYAVVRAALNEGQAGYELAEFPSSEEGGESSWSMLFVAPARRGGEVVGAVAAGIPLWRMAQRLGRQLQIDHAEETGLIVWVYMYKGGRLFHFGTPATLDQAVPDAAARENGLRATPSGFTGQLEQLGRWFAYGVFPSPDVGEDVGLIIFRSNPPE